MDLSEAVLTCAINIQWTSTIGVTGRKLSHRVATLRLLRNDLREMFIEITPEKLKPFKFKLKGITIHKKFMSEGKASINFKDDNCCLFISNAPPATLVIFLRILFVKLNGTNEKLDETTTMKKKIRDHLLSGRPSCFAEVSPVTTAEMIAAKRRAGLGTPQNAMTTSPQQISMSRKRTHDDNRTTTTTANGLKPVLHSAKKLYQNHSTTTTASDDSSIKPSQEQMDVLRACTSGQNVFFTGSAGTGKSFLLRKIISALPPDGTVVTASTGVAACLIGGVTLHAFAGIGGGDASLQRCFQMASRPSAAQAWRKCKRLIVDEISMVDGLYFEKIEEVARHIRRNDKPFGGIQLILCGDFFQLPPVIRQQRDNNNTEQTVVVDNPNQRFCFQSPAWAKCIQTFFELNEVHRQSDPEFIKILNHIRIGHVNEDITQRLLRTSMQNIESDGILATQLCSHTNDANSINETKLENLDGEMILFKAEDSDPTMTKQLDAQIQAPSQLYLKVNAQVMLLKNLNVSAGLVNGARGVITRFEKGVPIVRFKNNREYVCRHEKWTIKMPSGGTVVRRQLPLKLAWAFSIHKSQGLTLDCVEMSLSKVFEAGQAYVALSRAKSLESVRVLDFDAKQVWANPQVLQFYKLFRRHLHDTMIPLGGGNRQKSNVATTTIGKLKRQRQFADKPLVSIS